MVFLRSMQQWIGGIGIVVLSISTLMYGLSVLYLYREEQDSNRILPSVSQSSKTILKIYVFYTFAGTLLLWIAGLDFFSSLNNTMTALSTGGFSSGGPLFVNTATRIILTLIMIAGSMAFTVHYQLFSGQIKKIFQNVEVKTFFLLLVTGSLIFTPVIHSMGPGLGDSVVESVFNIVSAITTTGYASVDLSKLSDFGKLTLSFFMVIGGGYGINLRRNKTFKIHCISVWHVLVS